MRNIGYILSILCLLSCKKELMGTAKNNNAELSSKIENQNYQKIEYKNKELINGINVFTFKDKKITIQYDSSTLFGLEENKVFHIFSSNYDLDLGDIDLLRFDNENNQVYIVELKDYKYISYNLYIKENNQFYYLGNTEADLSNFVEINEKKDLNLKVNRTENNIFLEIRLKNQNFSNTKFEIKKSLRPYKTYNNIQNYIGNVISIDNTPDKNIIDKIENEYFSINIDEDEVMTINSKKVKKSYSNNKIFEGHFNCPDTNLDEIVLKNNYFTIQKYNCNDKYFLKEYITFKENDKGIILHNYTAERTDKYNPDKDIKSIIKTSKDFGEIEFENVTKDFLIKLIQN